MNTQNILIVGVGGQGTILASRVLAGVLVKQGLDVKVSEIHGMAQRGGSVVTQVRYGDKVYSPLIPRGEADVLLAFEKLEALRWLPWLRPSGRLLVNDQRLDPMPVVTGDAEYPLDACEHLLATCPDAIVTDALALATEAGNAKSVNVVLLGFLSTCLTFPQEIWLEVLKETVPARFLASNLSAFRLAAAGTDT
jgi:indolepyruvate ferredoxin oxidoreductase beta subunit